MTTERDTALAILAEMEALFIEDEPTIVEDDEGDEIEDADLYGYGNDRGAA